MDWRDRLTRATLGDFEFLTESHEAQSGRRLVVHTFPGRDAHELEDFGLKPNTNRLNAYFIGADYDLRANAFTALLAKPGAVDLIHPWLGFMRVRARDWSRSESNDKGGYCVISIDLIAEGGEQPIATIDPVDSAYASVEKFSQAALDDFDLQPMPSDTLTSFIAEAQQHLENIRKAISLATLPLTWANAAITVVAGVKNDIETLLNIPSRYASALQSMANAIGLGDGGDADNNTRVRATTRFLATATNPPSITAASLGTNGAAFRLNQAADRDLRSRLMLATAMQLALADYSNSNARDAVLAQVVAAIDALLPSMSDAVFDAALDARANFIAALTAQDLSALTERSVVNPMPAVVLAYQMGVSEDDLIAQNNVRHPLFVQGVIYG